MATFSTLGLARPKFGSKSQLRLGANDDVRHPGSVRSKLGSRPIGGCKSLEPKGGCKSQLTLGGSGD